MSTKLKSSMKKISHPLAKYNPGGQLFCVVCNTQVKNEMFWTGHINGKAHRDNVANLKNKGKMANNAAPAGSSTYLAPKRPAPTSTVVTSTSSADRNGLINTNNSSSSPLKKPKLIKQEEDDDEFLSPMPPPPLISILKKPKSKTDPEPPPKKKTFKEIEAEEMKMLLEIDEVLEVQYKSEENNDEDEEEEIPTAVLPEGFFDDAKEDAKVRGLEYKNPDEAEWERFKKEMATEEVKSTGLRTADEEDSAKDRELEEIEEQMKNWRRVHELEKKAEEIRKEKKVMQMECDVSDGEDLDYEEDLDWRSKKY